jgi:hypothetical protein
MMDRAPRAEGERAVEKTAVERYVREWERERERERERWKEPKAELLPVRGARCEQR